MKNQDSIIIQFNLKDGIHQLNVKMTKIDTKWFKIRLDLNDRQLWFHFKRNYRKDENCEKGSPSMKLGKCYITQNNQIKNDTLYHMILNLITETSEIAVFLWNVCIHRQHFGHTQKCQKAVQFVSVLATDRDGYLLQIAATVIFTSQKLVSINSLHSH